MAKKRFFYLGEWHFHPDSSSHASLQDIIGVAIAQNVIQPTLVKTGSKKANRITSAKIVEDSF